MLINITLSSLSLFFDYGFFFFFYLICNLMVEFIFQDTFLGCAGLME